jgi:hypothetical protein
MEEEAAKSSFSQTLLPSDIGYMRLPLSGTIYGITPIPDPLRLPDIPDPAQVIRSAVRVDLLLSAISCSSISHQEKKDADASSATVILLRIPHSPPRKLQP